jgi:hypothetical protein
MTTTKQDQPILAEWLRLGEEGQRKLFPSPDHREGADTFAQHGDKFRTPTGDFIFRAALNMAVLFSNAAVLNALNFRGGEGAKALAKVVTLNVNDPKHKAAITTLTQLIYHLEKTPATVQTKS